MSTLAIIGASGHGKVVADTALESGCWDNLLFFDDAFPALNSIADWPVTGALAGLLDNPGQCDAAVVAIGDNSARQQVSQQLNIKGIILARLIHPSAVVSRRADIAAGTVILPGAVVNACAVVGEGCIINSGAVVEHDCRLGQYVHICPQSAVAGEVNIGDRSWIGLGAMVRQGSSIAADVMLGAGAVVVENIEEAGVYVGNPCRLLQSEQAGN